MSNVNINRILEKTNNKIGYDNFESEENRRKMKIKKSLYLLTGIAVLSIGTLSVNALTDNSITKAIDNLSISKDNHNVSIKVNGNDAKTTCEELDNGRVLCKVNDQGIEYEITKEQTDYVLDISITEDDGTVTANTDITSLEQ